MCGVVRLRLFFFLLIFFYLFSSLLPASKLFVPVVRLVARGPGEGVGGGGWHGGSLARAAARPPRPGKVLQSRCDREARAALISASDVIGQLECHAPWAQSSNAPAGQQGHSLQLRMGGWWWGLLVPARRRGHGERQSAKSLSAVNKKQTSSCLMSYICVPYFQMLWRNHIWKHFALPT